jgi:hypothetical protein
MLRNHRQVSRHSSRSRSNLNSTNNRYPTIPRLKNNSRPRLLPLSRLFPKSLPPKTPFFNPPQNLTAMAPIRQRPPNLDRLASWESFDVSPPQAIIHLGLQGG